VIYISQKKGIAWIIQPGSDFDDLKCRFKNSIFKCIFWLNGLLFEGDYWCSLEEVAKAYLMAIKSPPNSPTCFLSLDLSSMPVTGHIIGQ
jgi:hypothetical protein